MTRKALDADQDPIMTAAEADHAAAETCRKVHQRNCVAFWADPRRECADCASLEAHVERTRRQMELLAAPGVTEELF